MEWRFPIYAWWASFTRQDLYWGHEQKQSHFPSEGMVIIVPLLIHALIFSTCFALLWFYTYISSCVGIVGVRRNQSRRCCTQWTHQPKVPFDWLTQWKDTHRAKLDKGLRHEILKNYELQVISSLSWPFQLLQLTTEDIWGNGRKRRERFLNSIDCFDISIFRVESFIENGLQQMFFFPFHSNSFLLNFWWISALPDQQTVTMRG